MLNTVDNLPCADLQNVDTRFTSAKDVLFIVADLENNQPERLRTIVSEVRRSFVALQQSVESFEIISGWYNLLKTLI